MIDGFMILSSGSMSRDDISAGSADGSLVPLVGLFDLDSSQTDFDRFEIVSSNMGSRLLLFQLAKSLANRIVLAFRLFDFVY